MTATQTHEHTTARSSAPPDAFKFTARTDTVALGETPHSMYDVALGATVTVPVGVTISKLHTQPSLGATAAHETTTAPVAGSTPAARPLIAGGALLVHDAAFVTDVAYPG